MENALVEAPNAGKVTACAAGTGRASACSSGYNPGYEGIGCEPIYVDPCARCAVRGPGLRIVPLITSPQQKLWRREAGNAVSLRWQLPKVHRRER